MIHGNVKWFDVKKGFGFIVGPDGQDVFVHFSSIAGDGFKTLKDGEPVEYVLHAGDKGWHAREVRRVQGRLADGGFDGHDSRISDGAISVDAATDGQAVNAAQSRQPTTAH